MGVPFGGAADSVASARAADSAAIADSLRALAARPAVRGFLAFDVEQRTAAAADVSHTYIAEGIRRLASAMGEVAHLDSADAASLRPRLTALERRADELQRETGSRQHARYAHAAFASTAAAMSAIQRAAFPELLNNVNQLRRIADSLQSRKPLLDQMPLIQQFFDLSAGTLRAMVQLAAVHQQNGDPQVLPSTRPPAPPAAAAGSAAPPSTGVVSPAPVRSPPPPLRSPHE